MPSYGILIIVLAVAALLAARLGVFRLLLSRRSKPAPVVSAAPARTAPGGTPSDFTGKVAVITGGGTGLGREISLNLARRGAKLVVASRSPEHLNAVAAEIKHLR